MGRQEFEDHCDELLLSHRATKKSRSSVRVNNPFILESGSTPRGDGGGGHSESHSSGTSQSSSSKKSSSVDADLSSEDRSHSNSMREADPSDEDSNNSEVYVPVGLRPGRLIGGTKSGQIFEEGPALHGFEDYTLYIKQLIVELKILLLPIYQSILRGQNEHNESHLGAGGHSRDLSSRFESMDSSFSNSFSMRSGSR